MVLNRTSVRIIVPLHRLWLFPLVAGTSWFVTLAAMMLTWIGRGCPQYPGQRNPYIPFISDVGAFQLKPLFLIGGITTASCFAASMIVVHLGRYDRRMYGMQDDPAWKQWTSVVAMSSGIVAGVGLVLLTILDTFRFHEEHAVLLLVCFVGLALSMVLTMVTFWDQTWNPSPFKGLRASCIASAAVVLIDVVLGATFYTLMQLSFWRTSGVLEWVMAFTGAFYLWSLVGFVRVPEEGIDGTEREALVRP